MRMHQRGKPRKQLMINLCNLYEQSQFALVLEVTRMLVRVEINLLALFMVTCNLHTVTADAD